MRTHSNKVMIALLSGILVAATAILIDVSLLQNNVSLMHQLMGDGIAGLIAILLCLAIQLKNEESQYKFALERAAIVAEVNHHVRNAVFPLFLAVQKSGDPESGRMATEAMERINIALKDATTDAILGRVDYQGGLPDRSKMTQAA